MSFPQSCGLCNPEPFPGCFVFSLSSFYLSKQEMHFAFVINWCFQEVRFHLPATCVWRGSRLPSLPSGMTCFVFQNSKLTNAI